jgi:hypothetical protein
MTTKGLVPCVSEPPKVDLSEIRELVKQIQEEEALQREGKANG